MALVALPDTPIDYGADLEHTDTTQAQPMGDNYVIEVSRGINRNRQTWRISWNGVDAATEKMLREFFRDLGADRISWTPPNQDDELQWRPSGGFRSTPVKWNCWNTSITLEQRF